MKKIIKILFKISFVSLLILCMYLSDNKFYHSMFYYLMIIYWSVCTINPTYLINFVSNNKTYALTKYQIIMYRILGILWIILSVFWLKLIN
jgi:hypothetical protein